MRKKIVPVCCFLLLGLPCGPLQAQIWGEVTYDFPQEETSKCYSEDIDKCYMLIENQAHYLLSLVKDWNGCDDYKLITASKGPEEHITRPNTGAVAIFSFLYRFGPYSEKKVGISRDALLNDVIIPMMRYLVNTHKTSYLTFDDGRQWGLSWQSAHWTHQLAQGAATVWYDLPEEIKNGVLRVVYHEANRISKMNPPYALTFDSKSEENAWNAGAISAALLLMPNHIQAPLWEKSLKRWLLSSYIRADDRFLSVMIDGVPVKDMYKGANIFNDYTLENHGIVHPDYMTACTLKGEILIDYLASGRTPTDACMFNVDHIYEQLKLLLLPSGGFMYPTGQDWAIFRHADWANIHAFCLYYFHDSEALHWLRVTLNVIERMQKRHVDGRIYGENENFFPSSQTLSGLGLVDCWKMLMLADEVQERLPQKNVSRIYPDGKFYIHRAGNAVHSISWGKKLQIQVMVWDKDPIMAPDWRNGIASILLEGKEEMLPIQLQSIEMDTLSTGLCFTINVLHGDVAQESLVVRSQDDGRLVIHEELRALKEFTSKHISILPFGILNHPSWIEEKGFRQVYNGSKSICSQSLSGEVIKLSGNIVRIDDRMVIKSRYPLRGTYLGAMRWIRSKVLDHIILKEIEEICSWNEGDMLSKNEIMIFYK